jgi:hypothetical protein
MASKSSESCRARKSQEGLGPALARRNGYDARKSIAAGSDLNRPRRDQHHDLAAQKTTESVKHALRAL